MTIIGIDYSLTCPCVCVSNNTVFGDSYFYFLHGSKTYARKVLNIIGEQHGEYLSDQQRYENIAMWVMNIISSFDIVNTHVLIEDYSFGSKGRVFNLAENCGLLKYSLYKKRYNFSTVAPSVIKKFATGKGNADKQKMYDAFYTNTKVDLIAIFSPKSRRLDSPVTDIVDSYYLTCYMHDSLKTNDMEKLNRGTNKKNSRKHNEKL